MRLTADCRLRVPQEQRAAAAAAQGAADQQRRRAEELEAEHGRAVAQGAQLQGDLYALQARRPCALPAHLHPIAAVPGGGPSMAATCQFSMHVSSVGLPDLLLARSRPPAGRRLLSVGRMCIWPRHGSAVWIGFGNPSRAFFQLIAVHLPVPFRALGGHFL